MKTKLFLLASVFALLGCVACENVKTDDQIVSLIDKLDEEQTLPLFGGLTVEKVGSTSVESPRSESLTDRIVRYFKSHELKFEISEARESGGKIKPVIVKKVKST